MDLNAKIRRVPDFPKPGIEFYDITTVLEDAEAFHEAIDRMKDAVEGFGCDLLVGLESRGFIFASPIAYALGKGVHLIRKPGKLPCKTISTSYSLEYGKDSFEIHEDAVKPGEKCVIVDDLLATGGTVGATVKLIEQLGGIVSGIVFFIEIEGLEGRQKIGEYPIVSIVKV